MAVMALPFTCILVQSKEKEGFASVKMTKDFSD